MILKIQIPIMTTIRLIPLGTKRVNESYAGLRTDVISLPTPFFVVGWTKMNLRLTSHEPQVKEILGDIAHHRERDNQ